MTNDNLVLNDSLGITLSTRAVASTVGRDVSSHQNQLNHSTLESSWNLSNMVERTTLIKTITWRSAINDPAGTVLDKFILPLDLLVNHLNNAPFDNFTYWRGDIDVHFQVNATPMHQGMVKAVYCPLTFIDAFDQVLDDSMSISINPHVNLFANANSSVKLTIPFMSQFNYLNVESGDLIRSSLGSLALVVFNPLESSPNSTQDVTISMFCTFRNSEFKVPRLKDDVRPLRSLKFKPQSSGIVSTVLDIAKPLVMAGVGTLTGGLIPQELLSDGIDLLRGVTGLDNPSDYSNHPIQSFSGPMNYATGPCPIEKLAPFPAEVATIGTDDISMHTDEMAFSHLFSRSTYIGTFDLTVDNTPGEVLASFPVNPNPMVVAARFARQPLIGYFAMPFQLWKGGISYKVEVVSTSLQTCKLFIAFNPGTYRPTETFPLPSIATQYGMAIEVNQGSNTFEFTAPYISQSPFLNVPHSYGFQQSGVSAETTVGYINVVVLNRLICPNNTPTTIHFNVYTAGAEDFIVRNLSTTNIWAPIEDPGEEQDQEPEPKLEMVSVKLNSLSFKPQSLNQIPLNVPEQKEPIVDNPVTLAPSQPQNTGSGTINPGTSLTFKDYCKKLQFSGIREFSSSGTILPLNSFLAIDTNSRNNGLIPYITAPFRCMHGGLRFKLQQVSTSETAALAVMQFRAYYLPPIDRPYTGNVTQEFLSQFQETTVDTGIPYTRLNVSVMNSIQRTLYFEVPYSVIYDFMLTDHRADVTFNSTYTDYGSVLIFADGPIEEFLDTFKVSIHFSFADETRSFGLYKIPVLSRPAPIFPDEYDTTLPITTLRKLF